MLAHSYQPIFLLPYSLETRLAGGGRERRRNGWVWGEVGEGREGEEVGHSLISMWFLC